MPIFKQRAGRKVFGPHFQIINRKKPNEKLYLTEMKKTILFVDDEEINLFVLQRRFEDAYEVLTASSAKDALDIIQQQKDVLSAIVSDLRMPEMSGAELIKEAQAILPEIPCFLLTGYSLDAEPVKGIASHEIKKVFKKPFDYNEIHQELQAHLG